MSFCLGVEPCRSARFLPLMASRLSTGLGSLPIAQRSPKILKSSPALLKSVWRFFLLPIRFPKSTKSAPCTLMPARPKSGFARLTAPFPFLFLLIISHLLLPFAQASLTASREASQLVGVSYTTLWRAIRRGDLRPIKGMGLMRISKKELQRFTEDTLDTHPKRTRNMRN